MVIWLKGYDLWEQKVSCSHPFEHFVDQNLDQSLFELRKFWFSCDTLTRIMTADVS